MIRWFCFLGEYPEKEPRYQIVKMRVDSEESSRFNWGASCSGWFPLKKFPSREEAEKWINNNLKKKEN